MCFVFLNGFAIVYLRLFSLFVFVCFPYLFANSEDISRGDAGAQESWRICKNCKIDTVTRFGGLRLKMGIATLPMQSTPAPEAGLTGLG